MMTEVTINAAQCAELLKCTEDTVEELTRKGELPGIKIGRGWIYVKSDLVQYLAEKARAEAEERREQLRASLQATPITPRVKARQRVAPALPALPRASAPSPHP